MAGPAGHRARAAGAVDVAPVHVVAGLACVIDDARAAEFIAQFIVLEALDHRALVQDHPFRAVVVFDALGVPVQRGFDPLAYGIAALVEAGQFTRGRGHDVVLVATLVLAMLHAIAAEAHRPLDEGNVTRQHFHLMQVIERGMVGRHVGLLVAVGALRARRRREEPRQGQQYQQQAARAHGTSRRGNTPTTSERSSMRRATLSMSMPRARNVVRPLNICTGPSAQK